MMVSLKPLQDRIAYSEPPLVLSLLSRLAQFKYQDNRLGILQICPQYEIVHTRNSWSTHFGLLPA